ncbi:MAG TPA: GNAT family N-acetyltransferase [Candidatus Chromulinivoraceae bacterium]|nr:GNAT family N-acetyltransferase [Candidatus Chromulinivoraceae bacterium]
MHEKIPNTSPDIAVHGTGWLDQVDDRFLDELTDNEETELAGLHIELDAILGELFAPRYYVDSREKDIQLTYLRSILRLKLARISELTTGYPQTGSAASVIATKEASGHDLNPHFKLERRIDFFNAYADEVARGEQAAFGDNAFTTQQLNHYTARKPGNNTSESPIVVGHLRRNLETYEITDELCSYMLVLCSSHPDGPTAFDRDLPIDTVYLNGIWVKPEYRQEHLGSELGDELLADANNRPIYASVKADNFGMMHLLSRLGKNYRDPNYKTGLQSGRSRTLELLYWHRYFGDSRLDNRVMTVYDPGIFIPDSIATVRQEDIVKLHEVKQNLGRDRIAIYNGPIYNSAGLPRNYRVDAAVSLLLDDGEYVGIPLGNYRLYVRVDSLPLRTARNIRRRYDEVDERRERDHMTRFGRRILALN